MRKKKIYLLLTDTNTVLTKIIKLYTKMPYNHASISLNSELSEVYSFGRINVNNPFIGGFIKEDLQSILFQDAHCAIYSLTLTNEQYQKLYHFIKKLEAQKQIYRYNFLGLFGFLLNVPIDRKYAFFCSQFVAYLLKETEIINDEITPSLIKPGDLPHLADFQLVYEGRLAEYQNQLITKQIQFSYPNVPIKM